MAEIARVSETEAPPQETAIRRLIDAERQALDHTLDRLNERVRETLDWREHATRHRGKLLAAAGGAAMLAAWRWRRHRSPADRAAAVVADSARQVADQLCETVSNLGTFVSVRRRLPRAILVPLAGFAARAVAKWWDGDGSGGSQRAGRF
jgi:hypothetical protein